MAIERIDVHTASFDAGWFDAIEEVSKSVAEYLELLKSGRKADPWEEWLPRFLAELKRT